MHVLVSNYSLYCQHAKQMNTLTDVNMETLTRHSWVHHTVCWILKQVDLIVVLLQ